MIAIIDYGAGNVTSVRNCLRRLGCDVVVTKDISTLREAEKVIFPGVGEASYAMQQLVSTGLDGVIPMLTQPVLGICLGAQLLCLKSEEGNAPGLGIFNTSVKKFDEAQDLKFPHMGWNCHSDLKEEPFLSGIKANMDFYFVHGYFIQPNQDTLATVQYGNLAASILKKNNFYATQFHPEKSGENGRQIIENFLKA